MMNFYNTTMASKNKRKYREESSEIEDGFEQLNIVENETIATNNWPRFLMIQSSDKDRTVGSLSPFAVDKTLKGHCGTVKAVKKLRSGVLLVETCSQKQSENLLKLKSILDLAVTVSPHRSLNSCKGIVRSYDLAHTEEAESVSELSSQGVTAVRPIFVTRDGQKKRTNTCIVTFGSPTIPTTLKIGYLKVTVDKFYPSPLRCFSCQRFGHHRAACKHAAVCALCSLPHHGQSPCEGPKLCANCKGEHAAFDKTCPRWQLETAIVKARIDGNLSFPDAKKLVEARGVPVALAGKTYAAVARETKSISTQTDIVNCTCHCRAEIMPAQSHLSQPGTSSASIQTEAVSVCADADSARAAGGRCLW